MDKVQQIEIQADQAGQRLDNFLSSLLKGVPKSRIYRMIRKGEVRVNKGRIKPEYKLCKDDLLRIPPVRVSEVKPVFAGDKQLAQVRNAIIYDDKHLMVVNKPSGLAVHGGSGIRLGLIELLRQLFPTAGFLELVHRLDRDTSGCVMIAKKRSALLNLHKQLKSDRIDKFYLALVHGQWPRGRRLVELPLQKNTLQSGERMVAVAPEGKPAKTAYSVINRLSGYSLLQAKPITGRTHQIRVHCQSVGHSIAGDVKYTADQDNERSKTLGLRRLFLHAEKLVIEHPETGKPLQIEAPLAEELQTFLQSLHHLETAR